MFDVTKERNKYVGGSDMPAILGISSFTSRWELLKHKAGIEENDFEGNAYTEYGQIMEPIIRQHVSDMMIIPFEPDMRIDGRRRYHADGFANYTVLEIKTTSHIKDTAPEYVEYMAQLQMGIDMFDADCGILAVYERPSDFSTDFDPLRLQVFMVGRDDDLIAKERAAAGLFLADLDWLKNNPFAQECELPSMRQIVPIADKLIVVEQEIQKLFIIEELKKKEADLKSQLKTAMESLMFTSYTDEQGNKLTLVRDGVDKEIDVFDETTFREDNPELWESYLVKKIRKGRAGHVRYTPAKER